MRKLCYCLTFLTTLLPFSGAALAVHAPMPLIYHGGPVMSPVIVPIYWGKFSGPTDPIITGNQDYLIALAQFMSGANMIADGEPVVRQYGVWGASVAPPILDTTTPLPSVMNFSDVAPEIARVQQAHPGLSYGPSKLFILTTNGIALSSDYDQGCGFHSNAGSGKYYANVPFPPQTGRCAKGSGKAADNVWQQRVSHEIFEASTDPLHTAWFDASGEAGLDEGADPMGCFDSFANNFMYLGGSDLLYVVASFVDNKATFINGGTVSCGIVTVEQYAPLAVVSRASNTLDVFYQGTDHALWHKPFPGSFPGTWGAAHSLGGNMAGTPSAVSIGNGAAMHVVAFGTSNGLFDRSWRVIDGWSPGFVQVGSSAFLFGSPSAVRTDTNRFDVFAQDAGLPFVQAYFDGSWHEFFVGPTNTSNAGAPPIAVPFWDASASTTYPVVLWSDQTLMTKASYTDRNNSPVHPATSALTYPAGNGRTFTPMGAAHRDFQIVDAFSIGLDRNLYRNTNIITGNWGAWANLGIGTFVGAPVAVSWGTTRTDAFVVGTDWKLYHVFTSDSGSSWFSQILPDTGRLIGTPAVASWGPSRLDVFAKGADDRNIRHYYSNDGSNWSSETLTDTTVN